MIVLNLKAKVCMSHLLLKPTFDTFSLIEGEVTTFKFILSLAKDQFESFLTEHDLTYRPAEIQGLYLNFRYDGLALQCITGTSMNTFTMDKSVEKAWDEYVQKFFASQELDF